MITLCLLIPREALGTLMVTLAGGAAKKDEVILFFYKNKTQKHKSVECVWV